MRKEREKAGRRQRNLISIAIVVVVIGLIALGAWAVKNAMDPGPAPTLVAPKNTTDDFGIVYDEAPAGSDPVSVELYEDFQCPICVIFEHQSSGVLAEMVESGEITITYRPFSFLDEFGGSPNRYSHRATNVALCALDQGGVADYVKVHDYLFTNQPEERTKGPADAELIKAVAGLGITGIDSCVESERFMPWVDEAMKAGEKRGVEGTPTVFVDGQQLENPMDVTSLPQAIKAAQKG